MGRIRQSSGVAGRRGSVSAAMTLACNCSACREAARLVSFRDKVDLGRWRKEYFSEKEWREEILPVSRLRRASVDLRSTAKLLRGKAGFGEPLPLFP